MINENNELCWKKVRVGEVEKVQEGRRRREEGCSRGLKEAIATKYVFGTFANEDDGNYLFKLESETVLNRRVRKLEKWYRILYSLPINGQNLSERQDSRAINKETEALANQRGVKNKIQKSINKHQFNENDDLRKYLEKRIREYFLKEGKKDATLINEAMCNQEENGNNVTDTDGLSQLPIDLNQTVIEQLDQARSNPSYSKVLVKALQMMDSTRLEVYVAEIKKDFLTYVSNENTCYIVKCLAKRSDLIVNLSKILIFKSLDTMLEKVHTCRLVYTLCIYSERFRESLLFTLKGTFIKMISTLQGAILISLLVSNMKDFKKCKFIEAELSRDHDLVQKNYFCRAFTSYMHRCPEDVLTKIALIFESNLSYLLNDNFGNYLLQIFFERDCPEGMEMCKSNLLKTYRKSLIRRYSRYVLLKALQKAGSEQFSEAILEKLVQDSSALVAVCRNNFSHHLMILALLNLKSPSKIKRITSNILDVCAQIEGQGSQNKNSEFILLVQDLQQIRSNAVTLATN